MPDDDVVENIDVKEVAGVTEAAGDALVVAGGFGVPGGVVVGDHDGCGAVTQRVAENLARGDEGVVDRTDGYGRRRDEPVLDIEVERYGVLTVKVLQERDEKLGGGFGTGDLKPAFGCAWAVDARSLAGASGTGDAQLLCGGG